MGLRVVELFAGVGGFRLGLDQAGGFDTIWFNQWEPATKAQHAYDCYVANFYPEGLAPPLSNTDIMNVPEGKVPDHDLLVGGFPCQDYSVAATLDKSQGLQGKKGVLWWEIRRILEEKRPSYVLLENVDRLLRSPASQRGRDFAVLLACMRDLGYVVEWRVLNAADYGFPQKRRRVFIFAACEDTPLGDALGTTAARPDHLTKEGFFAGEFPVRPLQVSLDGDQPPDVRLPRDLHAVSEEFDFHFQNAGIMFQGHIWTQKVHPRGDEPVATLGSILGPCSDERYYIPTDLIDAERGWRYFRGAKNEDRVARNGHQYRYTEGSMAFPDPSDQPARTILTGEGGTSPSRTKHAVVDPATGRIRTLRPEECEALNGFPEGHTAGIPERWRYFTMGNALVVGLVTRIGQRLQSRLAELGPGIDERAREDPVAATSE
ncbi:MAG: DNA (cytosine-5-)-methyltransferase [Thermoplasmatota archaeon]